MKNIDPSQKRTFLSSLVPSQKGLFIFFTNEIHGIVYDDGTLEILPAKKVFHRGTSQRLAERKPIRFKDLYSAIRSQTHALDGYQKDVEGRRSEISDLMDFDEEMVAVIDLLQGWKGHKDVALEQVETALEAIDSRLKHCRDPFKRNARRIAADSAKCEDSLERQNPGATSAKICKARAQLAKRLESIWEIAPRIAKTREKLCVIRGDMERRYESVTEFLRELILKHDVWTEKTPTRADINNLHDLIYALLETKMRLGVRDNGEFSRLTIFWINPYKSLVETAAKLAEEARQHLETNRPDIPKARAKLEKALEVLESKPDPDQRSPKTKSPA